VKAALTEIAATGRVTARTYAALLPEQRQALEDACGLQADGTCMHFGVRGIAWQALGGNLLVGETTKHELDG
jgi:hypothetical protein